MTVGIYRITCLINGKVYIGKSVNCEVRIAGHKNICSKPHFLSGNRYMHADAREYGIENFRFEIIRPVAREDYHNLGQIEIDEIIRHRSFLPEYGYNRSLVMASSPRVSDRMYYKKTKPSGEMQRSAVTLSGKAPRTPIRNHVNRYDQYDLEGKFVHSWHSVSELLAKYPDFKRQGFHKACEKFGVYKGFRWKKEPVEKQ